GDGDVICAAMAWKTAHRAFRLSFGPTDAGPPPGSERRRNPPPPPYRDEDVARHLPQSSTEGGKQLPAPLPPPCPKDWGRWRRAKRDDGGGETLMAPIALAGRARRRRRR